MEVLRTPDQQFKNLPNYVFSPNYIDKLPSYKNMRIHYLDEGNKKSDEVFLCLHGQPSWSYLYRKMIPKITDKGFRSVAPDWLGFGKSDKPKDQEVYTFDFHRKMMLEFITELDLRNITLVCQDWGGLLGLTIPMEFPSRFKRLIVMNTMFATGDYPLSKGFLEWRSWNNANPDMNIAKLMKRSAPFLTEEECQGYEAPFVDSNYKAGVRAFPNLVPDKPDFPGAEVSRRARAWWQNEWTGQSFMAIGQKDPVIGEGPMQKLREFIRGCPEPLLLPDAGHFVQEHGEVVIKKAFEYFKL